MPKYILNADDDINDLLLSTAKKRNVDAGTLIEKAVVLYAYLIEETVEEKDQLIHITDLNGKLIKQVVI